MRLPEDRQVLHQSVELRGRSPRNLGIEVEDKATRMAVLTAVKDKAMEKGGLVTPEEFSDIVAKVLPKD